MTPSAVKLDNPIQNYAWGSHRLLAEFCGRSAPTSAPEAELWMGTHPGAPSRLAGSETSLGDWIAAHASEVLGAPSGELPFLVKLLAAGEPLSIQVHPGARQAAEGFRREEAAGIPRDAATRSYRDANPKHEMLLALTPFSLLCDFRPDAEIRTGIRAAGSPTLSSLLPDEATSLGFALLSALQALDAKTAQEIERELTPWLGAQDSEAARWMRRIAPVHPGDALLCAPLLMNIVRLEPREALRVHPGTLHSYLEGFGLEVMTCSDNVVRGGLTRKHRDPEELARLCDGVPALPDRVEGTRDDHETLRYESGSPVFRVSTRCIATSGSEIRGRGPCLIVALEGRVLVEAGAAIELSRGESALVPAARASFRVSGAGEVAWVDAGA